MLKAFAITILVSMPTLASAQEGSERERYTLPVTQLDDTTFEVIEADGAGGTQIWCAAGLYARNVLGQSGGDLYIAQGRGPAQTTPGRIGITFSTQPVAGAFSSLIHGVRRTGQVFSMSHAYSLCRDLPFLRVRTPDNTLIRR